MTHDIAQQLIDDLDDILEAEKAALLAGSLDQIARLLDRKEALFDALNALDADPGVNLGDLKSKVDRNQALLESALQGIRRVAGRMAAFRKIRDNLETYDSSGRRQTIQGDVARKVEKRA